MKRIVAFGCSHTFGHGLQDCVLPLRQGPSQLSWSAVLAKKLNLMHVNCAAIGIGNKFILHKILEFDFKAGDIAVVLWSHSNRRHFFETEQNTVDINSWNNTEQSRFFIKNLSFDYDELFESCVYANHAHYYFKEKIIPYFYNFADHKMHEDSRIIRDKGFVNIDFVDFRKKHKPALDGQHMGHKGHTAFAKEWHKLILQQLVL